jgi:glycyl-tRNA synthetase alpha subunit
LYSTVDTAYQHSVAAFCSFLFSLINVKFMRRVACINKYVEQIRTLAKAAHQFVEKKYNYNTMHFKSFTSNVSILNFS